MGTVNNSYKFALHSSCSRNINHARKMYMEYKGSIEGLSDCFFVGEMAVAYRVSNLSLDRIDFNTLKTSGRKKAVHCAVCGNIDVSLSDNYCKICGNESLFIRKDTGWVKYGDGIELDNFGHAMECPACHTMDVILSQKTCPACGANLFQRCSGYNKNDDGIDEKGCGSILDGSARYCTRCGHKSAFYRDGYLKDWQEELGEILKKP